MKKYLSPLLLIFTLITCNLTQAQELNFSIQYPLDIDFAGSGVENDQMVELANQNLVLYRFTLDTTTNEHKIHFWCTNPTGYIFWSKEITFGIGNYLRLTAGLCANGNSFALTFPKVYGDSSSIASVAIFDENGALTGGNIEFSVPNATMAEDLNLVYSEGEYYVSGTAISENGTRRVFVAHSQNGSFAMSDVTVVNELGKVHNLYVGTDQKAHLIGRRGNADADYPLDPAANGIGVKFNEELNITDAISDPVHGTYYAGALGSILLSSENAVLIHRNAQNILSCKSLYTTGPMFHGSFSTDLAFHDDGVVIIGYGSVPHPINFLSRFDWNDQLVLNREFGIYQPFNYNRTSLLAHSSGKLYYSVLGGVFTNGIATFSTIFSCLDSNYQTDCDGDIISSVYNNTSVSETPDTITFVQEGNISIVDLQTHDVTFTDSIPCSTNLGIADYVSINAELYPNPFQSETTLRFDQSIDVQNVTVVCSDESGRKIPVDQLKLSGNEMILQFPNDVRGMVFIRIKSQLRETVVKGILH